MRASNGHARRSPSNTVCKAIQKEEFQIQVFFVCLFVFKSPFGRAFATDLLICVSMHRFDICTVCINFFYAIFEISMFSLIFSFCRALFF